MDKTRVLGSFSITVGVLRDMAAREERHADQLDAISKGAGDRSRGVAAGLGIAVHLIKDILRRYGEEGQDAEIDIQVYRDQEAVAGATGPGDRAERDLPAQL